jgi:hypothetical protein
MPDRNVVIVIGRCNRSKQGFGIRFERASASQWTATWAFPIRDAVAKREGYASSQISGAFAFDSGYPGCPHCQTRGIFKCACGKVACWDGESKTVTCPWCGVRGELSGQVTDLSAGGDR